MKVVANNNAAPVTVPQQKTLAVQILPADEMKVIKSMYGSGESSISLSWDNLTEDEEANFLDIRAKGVPSTSMKIYKIKTDGQKTKHRLALNGDGTWHLWTKHDV
jgi:hypothetical protein